MARTFLLMLLFLVPAPGVLAQTPESLPESSAYKGEIRRGPDGKLIVLRIPRPLASSKSQRR